MKKTILMAIFLMVNISSFALNVQSLDILLKQSNLSLEKLKQSGHSLLLGEVTGAGMVVPSERLEMIILRDKILKRGHFDVDQIEDLRELDGFVSDGQFYPIQSVEGIIIK